MLFKDKYFFLSNFYPCDVVVEINNKKIHYKNVEAAYQAQKNVELAERYMLLSGAEAKKLGKTVPITTEGWYVEKVFAMAKCLHSKFQNYGLLFYLKLVKDEIIEDNYWNDTFWGVCKGEGKNILGKMLMNIRDNDNDYNCLIAYINKEIVKLCTKED